MLKNIFNNILSKKTLNIPYLGRVPKEENFNFDLIEYYFKHKVHLDNFQIINDRIMNDIDFQELFIFIDRTRSKIGQQYLYDQLLTINMKIDFKEQEQIISYFIENEEKKIKIQSLLSKINRRESYYISNLFIDEYIPKPKLFWVIEILSVFGIASFIFTFVFAKIFFLLLFFFIINMIWNKRNILVYIDSIPQLPLLCKIASELTKMNIISQNNYSIFSSIESIKKIENRIKFFKFGTKIRSEIEILLMIVWENIKILFLIEPLIVFHVLKKLDRKREDIQTIFEYIGKIDSAISIASIRREVPYYCNPNLSKKTKSLSFTEIYHPFISNCVSNSLELKNKSILLTGSNMSGKTTFIRTIAINLLLAQTINTCFAKDLKLPQSRLFSAIRITDDLFNNKSYYFEEVLTIKDMVNESLSGSNNVFFLDEIFKGTNTVERIAAGKAVLSYLAKSDNNIIFVSTHDIELADLLNNNYDLYHFTEVIQNEQIHFDYKLKQGNLSTKNAIRILEINNYPKEIVDDAKMTSHILLKT